MGKRSDTDKAIRNILDWAGRPEWSDKRAAVFDTHLSPLCDHIGISQEELTEELAEHSYDGMLFGIMFEDFLSRRFTPDGNNIVDDYLKRRGWRETVPGRRYLQQLRDSVLSLYEVVEVSPGQHCDVRDLVRNQDSKTIRVHEHMGTQNLVKWDRLAARVLNTKGRYFFSGGILAFPREAAQSLLQALAEPQKNLDRRPSRAAGKAARDKKLSSVDQAELFLRDACPTFTSFWLMHTLESIREPLPEMVNRDGEALVFTETRFPFLAEQRDEIAERLDASPVWECDHSEKNFWVWLPETDANGSKSQHGLAFDTFRDGKHLLGGTLELKPRVLKLTTNSMERAQRGQSMLEVLLHDLIGPALSKLQTPDQLIAEAEAREPGDDNRDLTDTIDPEIAAELIHNHLDQHYRKCLDETIPVLDNKTPRQCAKSKKGREKVIEWLKHLENNELRRAADQSQAPYNSLWMWEELKLTKYRD